MTIISSLRILTTRNNQLDRMNIEGTRLLERIITAKTTIEGVIHGAVQNPERPARNPLTQYEFSNLYEQFENFRQKVIDSLNTRTPITIDARMLHATRQTPLLQMLIQFTNTTEAMQRVLFRMQNELIYIQTLDPIFFQLRKPSYVEKTIHWMNRHKIQTALASLLFTGCIAATILISQKKTK